MSILFNHRQSFEEYPQITQSRIQIDWEQMIDRYPLHTLAVTQYALYLVVAARIFTSPILSAPTHVFMFPCFGLASATKICSSGWMRRTSWICLARTSWSARPSRFVRSTFVTRYCVVDGLLPLLPLSISSPLHPLSLSLNLEVHGLPICEWSASKLIASVALFILLTHTG